MVEPSQVPRLTFLQRCQRLRSSYRFPFVLTFGLIVIGLLVQTYCYWWGVRLENGLIRIAGSKTIKRMEAYPATWPPVVTKWFLPIMPVQHVQLWSTQSDDSEAIVEMIRLLRGAPYLERFTLLGTRTSNMRPHLKRLTQLKSLQLQEASPEDAEVLSCLLQLEELKLRDVKWDSVKLFEAIAAMPNLIQLRFEGLGRRSRDESQALAASSSLNLIQWRLLDNQSLLDLTDLRPDGSAPLPNLLELRLESSRIGDDGLTNLKNLPSLIHLDISNTVVTDTGLKELTKLPDLRTLYLAYCNQITDKGVETLVSMQSLESLNIAYTSISEPGLMRLTRLKRLRRLRVSAGNHSPQVISELRKRLPVGCMVVN